MKYGVSGSNNNQNLDLRVFILPPLSGLPSEPSNELAKKRNNNTRDQPFADYEEEDEEITAENEKESEFNTLSHYLAMHDDLYCSVIY